MPDMRERQGIQVIARAASILRVLADAPEGLSLGRIAKAADLPRSTVQRIVAALATEGLVATGEGGVRLGPDLHRLARAAGGEPSRGLRPLMERIAAETGETVDLAILDGDAMLFVDQIVGDQRLRAVSRIGERFPLTVTANGKAALACLDEREAARRVLAEVERRGSGGRRLPDLLAELDAIRSGALAVDENEHTDGICAFGFATRDAEGVVHALSVPVPASRYARTKQSLSETLLRHRPYARAHHGT